MFISSMAQKQSPEMESIYNVRPLPSQGTKKRNPDEDFILRGRRTPVCVKPKLYRTNSERTVRADSTKTPLLRQSHTFKLTDCKVASDETLDSQDLSLDLSEFCDGPEEELIRLRDVSDISNSLLSSNVDEHWYTDPYHMQKSPPIDMNVLSSTNPLTASVIKSKLKGNFVSDPNEDIHRTTISEFDFSLFKMAEEEMFRARTISGLNTPYQEELTRLKLERLKLEEDRLLKKKCLDELERIRGPKPRWYELKTPDFHKEAKRNNSILSQSGQYREIMNYRKKLLDCL